MELQLRDVRADERSEGKVIGPPWVGAAGPVPPLVERPDPAALERRRPQHYGRVARKTPPACSGARLRG